MIFALIPSLIAALPAEPVNLEQWIQNRSGCFRVQYAFFDDSTEASDFIDEAVEYIEAEPLGDNTYSLQHVSIGRDPDNPDSSADDVTIHWREQWTSQADSHFEYQGSKVWKRVDKPLEDGEWLYSIFQIDGSLRSDNVGRMTKDGNFKFVTNAPLPRREVDAMKPTAKNARPEHLFYDVMVRFTSILPQPEGYTELLNSRKSKKDGQVVSYESGSTVFTRISDENCAPARALFEDQKSFWSNVREAWKATYADAQQVEIKSGRLIGEFLQAASDANVRGNYSVEKIRERILSVTSVQK